MAPKMHEVERELVEATGCKRKPKEALKRYYGRLTKAATELDEDVWAELSDEAQAWVNAAVESINAKKTPTTFAKFDFAVEDEEDEDEDDEDEDDDDEDDDEEDEEDEPAPKKSKRKSSTKKGKGKGKGKADKKPKKPKLDLCGKFRALMLKNPGKTMAQVSELAEKKGINVSVSTARTVFSQTSAALKTLRELDMYDHPTE